MPCSGAQEADNGAVMGFIVQHRRTRALHCSVKAPGSGSLVSMFAGRRLTREL